MGASDLRVTVDQAKLRCVLDPALVLGHPMGARLALRLTRVFEAWLTRSFWQVIDSSDLLERAAWSPGAPEPLAAPPDATALEEWIALRDQTDAGSWLLRWVGDCLAESQLQQRQAGDDGLVERYEHLAAALGERVNDIAESRDWYRRIDPVLGAFDALALSAALEGALILSPMPDAQGLPGPVQAMQRLQLPIHRLDAENEAGLFAAEREFVRQALVAAGVATLLQQWPPLAVVHALADADAVASPASGDGLPDPWAEAQAWWYAV